MESQRLSISMIEKMGFCEHYRFNDGRTFRFHNDEDRRSNRKTSDTSGPLTQSRGGDGGSRITHNYNNGSTGSIGNNSRDTSLTNNRCSRDNTNRSQQQRKQQQSMVLPSHLQSESSKRSFNASFSSGTTASTLTSNLSSSSSTIQFYRSPTKETYIVDERYRSIRESTKDSIPMNSISCMKCEESRPVQRGVDRSITLPRETHLQTAVVPNINTPIRVAKTTKQISNKENIMYPMTPSPIKVSLNDVNRNIFVEQPTKSSLLSPTSLMVSPEITRPTSKVISQNTSTITTSSSSKVLCMPPLYPLSPPQRPKLSTSMTKNSPNLYRSTRSSPSTIARRHLLLNTPAEIQQLNIYNTNVPSTITMTSHNSNISDVLDSRTRSVENMCLSPPNLIPADVTEKSSKAIETSNTNMKAASPVLLEIAPGVEIHLRGAEETQSAIDTGFYIQCECMVCCCTDSNEELYCILDCDYFICPQCRSIHPNPISTTASTTASSSANGSTRYPGGLGLGFCL